MSINKQLELFNCNDINLLCEIIKTKRQKKYHKRKMNKYEIKNLQYRLILISHCISCKCSSDCNKFKDCKQMKILLNHISHCSNINCKVKYCLSSRFAINHYYHCNSPDCNFCQPIISLI